MTVRENAKACLMLPLPFDNDLRCKNVTQGARQNLLKPQTQTFGAFANMLSALAAQRFRKTR